MARRPRIVANQDEIPKLLQSHLKTLGFAVAGPYYDWCWANGFDGTLEKSKANLQEEMDKFHDLKKKRETQNRLHKNPKAFLEAVCNGDLTSEEIDRPNFKMAASEIEASNQSPEIRESLNQMLATLVRHKDLIFDTAPTARNPAFMLGLIKIHDRKALWVRSLEDWKPKSKNSLRKFGELTHHLFDTYGDVPRFMEAVWLRDDRPSWRYRDWYIHLGRGHNLRTVKSPVPITKKMAHHFQGAPDDYKVEQAVRWAQMKALGASEQAIHAVAATRIARSFENEEFWFTVMRFIADNPMLDPRQIGPLVDYLHNQKFQMVDVELEPGEFAQQPPPQPGLSMAGRTVATLMRQVAEWHEALGKVSGLSNAAYAQSEIEGTTIEKKKGKSALRWNIRQLRSAKELQIESDELKHCVSSYHWSCSKGQCTIWSLSRSENGGKFERTLTIEVNKHQTIVQCRGLANRDPHSDEWAIVNGWARDQELSVATYL